MGTSSSVNVRLLVARISDPFKLQFETSRD